jgi:hypothetical protein
MLSYAAPHDIESALPHSRKIYKIAFGAAHFPANPRVFYPTVQELEFMSFAAFVGLV